MSVFIRRFLFDPGNDVLLNIESVNILDLTPPGGIIGIGTGTNIIVGEFENGPFAASLGFVTEVTSASDFSTQYGGLGYTYAGVTANYPCAVSRSADGALVPENWNGNGFVQLNGKQFSRLLIARVDTSVGAVQFTRNAFITGAASFRYQLVTGQVLSLDVGAGQTSATFTGVAATVTASGGTYPSTFAGGNTITLGYDGAPNFTVTFLAADQSIGQVIARINQYAGFTFASNSSGQIALTGLVAGTAGQVRVVAGSTGVLAQLGFTVGTTLGTGNVGNIAAVQLSEIQTVVQGAVANTKVEQDSQLRLRISNTGTTGFILVGSATTATALGFVANQEGTSNGQAVLVSAAETYPTGFAGTETLTLNIDNSPLNVTTAAFPASATLTQVVSAINTAVATQGGSCVADGTTRFYISGGKTNGSVQIVAASGGVLSALGLTLGTTYGNPLPTGSIPAGTVVQNTSGSRVYVTMQDISFTAGGVIIGGVTQTANGPWTVKVRPAVDDGTGGSASAAAITVVVSAPDLGAFSVINPQIINAALSESQIDAAYTAAIQATLNLNSVAKQANLMYSARQSNVVRQQLRIAARTASQNGMFGRMAMVRPPLNTPSATALSVTAEPGVGAYRDQRVVYCYIGANTFVPAIGAKGLAGGAGFTASGNVDVGSDGIMASLLSQLPPEENPGQETSFTGAFNGIETGSNVQNFQMPDYINFKAAGIAALRVDSSGTLVFQSGVTSVDPLATPSLVRISRRRMADFMQDSMAQFAVGFGKKLSTRNRRTAFRKEIRAFLRGLLSPDNPDSQRIGGFTVNDKNNSSATLGTGLYRITTVVQTLASLDSIVIESTVGETVQVQEVLPQAA